MMLWANGTNVWTLRAFFRVGVGAAVAVLAGCGKPQGGGMPPMPPPGVVVAPVVCEQQTSRRTYVGRAVAYDEVELVARVEGFLEQRNFSEGADVKKGQLLFLIEQADYKAKVDAAAAALQEAKASVSDAKREYDRQAALYAKNASSKRDLEQAETTKLVTEAKELAAQANLETARINLGYTEIRAPFDGRMGMATYSVGNMVGPSSAKLATIVRNDLIKVDFYVSEALFASHVQDKIIVNHRNDSVVPSLILPNGRPYGRRGELAAMDNSINDNTGALLLRAVFANPDNLLVPGMYVKVLLESRTPEKTLLVPAVAVQEDQEGAFVMVVDAKNLVHRRHVEIDNGQVGLTVVVKGGLAAGERIVVDGLQKAHDGAAVTPQSKPAGTAKP